MLKLSAQVASRLLKQTVVDNPWIPHTPENKQALFLTYPVLEILYGGAAGGGKLLELGVKIATPCGFRSIADLEMGDLVLGRDGKPHVVLAVSEPEMATAWRLTFDDGSSLVAHDEHRWLTFDAKELAALTRHDDGWRERRRESRPSRATGRKSEVFTAAITARNRATRPTTVAAPTGTIRTTREIAETLRTARNRTNHAVPVAAPLDLPEVDLPIDPYILGVWLGDGSTSSGEITTMDASIVDAVIEAGFPVKVKRSKPQKKAASFGFEGFRGKLREQGLLGNKHIPHEYLWAPSSQRLALLQGLMDTDGTVNAAGHAEFTTTNSALAYGALHLIRSLGHKARLRQGRATLRGKDCGPKWTIKFSAHVQVFRLERKATRLKLAHRRTTKFHYIVNAERAEPVPMRCIRVSADDGLYLAGDSLIPTHNSDGLLMAALQYIDTPGYSALLFRRTYADLALPGAIMQRAHEWLAGTAARWIDRDKTYIFPSGATLSFGYLEHENDKFRYQSAQFQFIGFDELTQFSESSYRYLFSRLRRLAGSKIPLRMRGGTNPGGVGHEWVRQRFIIEQTRDRMFIPATLDDNPHLDREEYIRSLSELDHYTLQQLLEGNWFALPAGSKFRREWFRIVDDVPRHARKVRYWDLAATEPKAGKDPDWTVGALLAEHDGQYWLCDIKRDRLTPKGVEALIEQTAELDGRMVPIWMEQEPGASGVNTIDHYARRVLKGFTFRGVRSTGEKEVRANPVSSAAEAGNLMLVRGPWISAFLDEAVSFPGGSHDDQIDALSGAFAQLTAKGPQGQRTAVSPPRQAIAAYQPR